MAKKSIWRKNKSGGGAGQRRQIFPDLAEKWKKFVRSQIWPRWTDPLKGQLFAKKGGKKWKNELRQAPIPDLDLLKIWSRFAFLVFFCHK